MFGGGGGGVDEADPLPGALLVDVGEEDPPGELSLIELASIAWTTALATMP